MGLVPLNLGEQEKQFSLETTKLSLSLSLYIYIYIERRLLLKICKKKKGFSGDQRIISSWWSCPNNT
jgi:hypothetical protein